jgi:NADPH-dependent 2,4-dienoyl-CoA reductase/sulfur reductase-like enzyme
VKGGAVAETGGPGPRLAVVGAGPAGIAAAVTAADAGIAVTVIDAGPQPGGQLYRQPAARLHARRPGALYHAWPGWLALRSRFDRHVATGRIRLLADHHVWFAQRTEQGYRLHALIGPEQERSVLVRADALLLATGAHERVLPFPGWTLPGVVSAGGAQAMLKGTLTVPGRETVVAGTGPLLLPVAAGLAAAGVQVKALIDTADPRDLIRHASTLGAFPGKLLEGLGYTVRLARHRVPIRYRHAVLDAHGKERVEAVTVGALDREGRVRTGSEQRIACDSLAIGHGLLPHLDLPLALGARIAGGDAPGVWVDEEQRTSVPGLWAAGETTGVGGAALARVEGEIAGWSAAARLRQASRLPVPADNARRRRRLRRFFAALDAAYSPPAALTDLITADTTICRCEEVTAAAVRDAVRECGATDPRTVKLLTRAGMGWCQGRMCGPTVTALIAGCRAAGGPPPGGSPAARPLAGPVPLGVLALDDPDEEGA